MTTSHFVGAVYGRGLGGGERGEVPVVGQAWKLSALCAETDQELFFPEKGGSSRAAKKVCLTCEVREECLEDALAREERYGIWGGLSERDRRREMKRREQAAEAEQEPLAS